MLFRLLKWCVSSWKDLLVEGPKGCLWRVRKEGWAENPPSEPGREMGSVFKKQGIIQSPGTLEGGRCVKLATLTLGEWNGFSDLTSYNARRSVILLVSSVSHLIFGSLNRLQQRTGAASLWSWNPQNAWGPTAGGTVACVRLQFREFLLGRTVTSAIVLLCSPSPAFQPRAWKRATSISWHWWSGSSFSILWLMSESRM